MKDLSKINAKTMATLDVRHRRREHEGCEWMVRLRERLRSVGNAINALDSEARAYDYPHETVRSYWAIRQAVSALEGAWAAMATYLPTADDLEDYSRAAFERLKYAEEALEAVTRG